MFYEALTFIIGAVILKQVAEGRNAYAEQNDGQGNSNHQLQQGKSGLFHMNLGLSFRDYLQLIPPCGCCHMLTPVLNWQIAPLFFIIPHHFRF